MRHAISILGLVGLAAAPIMATATVSPIAANTMLLQDISENPNPTPVKRHKEFLPVGLAALALAGAGIAVAASGSGNSPS